MNIFNVIDLFGGLALFLYGMRIMGAGLKESASGTLKKALESVTNSKFKAFLLGLMVTAVIQSSTATIVITSGLVAAGLLTLRQSLGIIVGATVLPPPLSAQSVPRAMRSGSVFTTCCSTSANLPSYW